MHTDTAALDLDVGDSAVSVSGGTADAASPLMMTLRLSMVAESPVFPCGTSVRWWHR